ncbi:MAG: hypothetical protein IKI31_04985 [Treponema sp.]|nr:hypothetical protein [Treponema sp.]
MMYMKKNFFAILGVVFLCGILQAQVSKNFSSFSQVPDSAAIRSSLVETWFLAPFSVVQENKTELRSTSLGEFFQIRMEEHDSTFSIVVAPRTTLFHEVYNGSEKETLPYDVYDASSSGSWVLLRDKKTGNARSIRYYVAKDKNVYAQFVPSNNTTYADFVVYENYVSRHVPVGVPFERFFTASVKEVAAMTGSVLPWNYAFPFVGSYDASINIVKQIRENLPNLIYAENAMYNEYGKAVYITSGEVRPTHVTDARKLSLSSAGFVKWVADGMCYPITKNYFKREPLIRPTVHYDEISYKGVLSTKHSISFTLDWTRNIASALLSIFTGRTHLYEESGVDMTEEPFTATVTSGSVKNAVGYIKNVGYPSYSLNALMYAFASKYPGECYFAAVYETDRRVEPEVKIFNQCAVLFPYFDSAGVFRCVVFRNGAEYTLNEFVKSFASDFVHLTRARLPERFEVQKFSY